MFQAKLIHLFEMMLNCKRIAVSTCSSILGICNFIHHPFIPLEKRGFISKLDWINNNNNLSRYCKPNSKTLKRIAMQNLVSISFNFYTQFNLVGYCFAWHFYLFSGILKIFKIFRSFAMQPPWKTNSWIMSWTTTPLGHRRRAWWRVWKDWKCRFHSKLSFHFHANDITAPDLSTSFHVRATSGSADSEISCQALLENKLHLWFIHDHIAISYLLALNLFRFRLSLDFRLRCKASAWYYLMLDKNVEMGKGRKHGFGPPLSNWIVKESLHRWVNLIWDNFESYRVLIKWKILKHRERAMGKFGMMIR